MSTWLHGLLRRLLPAELRRAHGDAMEEVFVEALAAARRSGWRATARLWVREALDVAATGWKLRAAPRRTRFGGPRFGETSVREGTMGRVGWGDDVRHAVRSLVRRPSLAAFAVLTIALGVGSTTAIFSALEAVILRPLPYEDAERMVGLFRRTEEGDLFTQPTREQVALWSEQVDLFEAVERWTFRDLTLTGRGDPRELRAAVIGPGFHDFVGRNPVLGRRLEPSDVAGDGARAVLLGHGLWRELFGSDPGAVGRTVNLDGEPWTVVGVMPRRTLMPGFGVVGADVWLPLPDSDDAGTSAVALLRDGVEIDAVEARLEGLPDPTAPSGSSRWVGAARFVTEESGGTGDAVILLMGGVVLLLLIACVNVSNLLLFRAGARRRETAVRAALGAAGLRLARQSLIESVLLALTGGVLGVAFAHGGLRVIAALRPERLTVLEQVTLDGPVLGFALLLTLGTGLLFGIVPALRASRPETLTALRSSRDGPASQGRRSRWVLVGAEVALSFALLLGAVQVTSTLVEKSRRDVGFEAGEVAVLEVTAPTWRYATEEERAPLFERLRQRAEALPGADDVSLASALPPRAGILFGPVEVEGRGPLEGNQVLHGPWVDERYFSALGLEIVRGRGFTAEELDGGRVVVLGEETARRFFPDGSAVGGRFRFGSGEEWTTVVGVARDVAMTGLSSAARPLQAYHPGNAAGARATLLVRGAPGSDPAELLPLLRELAREVDAELRVDRLTVADRLMADTLDAERFTSAILGTFAVLALLLAAVGLYGVVSHVVGERTREIGIRMALGARRGSVARSVLGRAGGAAAAGIGAGVGLAWVVVRLFESSVFGFGREGAGPWVAAALILGAAAVAAAAAPARRATRVDPVTAIRAD